MGAGRFVYLIGTSNNYSLLRWPSILNCLLITILSFILLISFNSNRWFIYDAVTFTDLITLTNSTVEYSETIEEGSFGLWYSCIDRSKFYLTTCQPWTDVNRPHDFTLITILFISALYLANLIIFPAWALFILIIHNINNRYERYIVGLIWALCLLTLISTCFLLSALVYVRSTKFHSPGKFFTVTQYITFSFGRGMFYLITGVVICIICFVLSILTLVGKYFIDNEVIEREHELLKQLSDENKPSIWSKPTMISRTPSLDDCFEEPPPYEYYNR